MGRKNGSALLPCLALLLLLASAHAHEAMVSYVSASGNGNSYPKIRFWNATANGSWGPEIELPDSGSQIRFAIPRQSPISTKIILIIQGTDNSLDAYSCLSGCKNVSNWVVTNDVASVGSASAIRGFDFQFETHGNDAILLYAVSSTNASRDLGYKILPSASTNFTGLAENYLDDSGEAGDAQYGWIRMDNDPLSDELVASGEDSSNNDINAWVWNGTSWGGQTELSSQATATAGNEALAARYASDGSKAMALGSEGTVGDVSWRYWDGSSWSSLGSFDVTGTGGAQNNADLTWASLKADPASDDMMLMAIDTSSDLNTAYWNGSAWAVTINIDTGLDSSSTRVADFEWEPSGSTGRLVWETDGNGNTLSQRACSPPNAPAPHQRYPPTRARATSSLCSGIRTTKRK